MNDALRCLGTGGRILITAGLAAHGDEIVSEVLKAVREFTAFTPDNDPHGEHDCAVLDLGELSIIWKIDLYEEPEVKDANGEPISTRVLTIMLAEEY